MRITIAAVGRLKDGPEKQLVDDYLARFGKSGRLLGLGPVLLREVEDRKGGGREAEAQLLRRARPDRATCLALDERGTTLSSREFAARLGHWRDEGVRDLVIHVGGADGLAADLCQSADFLLSFGPMVWPHMLARVMIAEQLYRATTILAGGPYHRD